MGKRNNHTDASDGSLSDAMSEHELEELEVQVASSPTRTPTPANRKKTPNKEGRKSVGTMVGESDDESVHMAKGKSGSMEIDDGEMTAEPDGPKLKKNKTLVRSKRGVAQVIEKKKTSPKAKPVATKASPPTKADAEHDDKPSSSPSKGATVFRMTTKISKLAEDAFEVAETWEGWLARYMPEENALQKAQMAIDKIAGKRKADVGGDDDGDEERESHGGSGRKKTKSGQR